MGARTDTVDLLATATYRSSNDIGDWDTKAIAAVTPENSGNRNPGVLLKGDWQSQDAQSLAINLHQIEAHGSVY